MTDHLCLKWNNHTVSFVKYIEKIQTDEKFCDATIACQGKYFPVHRIVLSTCSDYFDEIFDRMQSQHPYIVFKDIEPREMNLLLTYMYKGEVNVTQDLLPSLIKAAEALKIKGLAVPDDVSSNSDTVSGKRKNSSNDQYLTKKKQEESKRKIRNSDSFRQEETVTVNESSPKFVQIKEEPVDVSDYDHTSEFKQDKFQGASFSNESLEEMFPFSSSVDKSGIKCEENFESENSIDGQSLPPLWTNMSDEADTQSALSSETSVQQDMFDTTQFPKSTIIESGSQSLCDISQRRQDPDLAHPGFASQSKRSDFIFSCPYCDYKNRWRSKMNRHMLFKHSKERPFSCSFCSKTFVEKVAQQRHLRIHTGEKPFECQICSKKFRHKVNLKYHLENNLCQKN